MPHCSDTYALPQSQPVVHHINGNKQDNRTENIFLCKNQLQHTAVCNSLQRVAFELYEKGIIDFNPNTGSYYIRKDQILQSSLGFEEIAIKQKKNKCRSRLDVDIRSEVIRGITLNVPMLSSNMSTVTNADFAIKLAKLGAMGVLHRALSDENYVTETKKLAKECEHVAVSIGIDKNQKQLAQKLVQNGANIIFIDVAHGYSDYVINFAKDLKKLLPKTTKLVLGNTTNPEMFFECEGVADAIKCGIAQGFACETKNTAGCTERQFSAIVNLAAASRKTGIPIISDGAIREPADFTKAIGAGSNSIMAGKIFAACVESAAPTIEIDGKTKKLYAGMASRFVQNAWKSGLKEGTCPEGAVKYLDIGENVEQLVERYSGALRSGITYAGGTDIASFQESVDFVRLGK